MSFLLRYWSPILAVVALLALTDCGIQPQPPVFNTGFAHR